MLANNACSDAVPFTLFEYSDVILQRSRYLVR